MPRFVLVHGGFSGAWIWLPLMDRLKAAGHLVEAFDLPGMGDDHRSASEVSLDSYAGRVCEVLAANSEPAIVVGHSMGGIVVTQAAARCPERVAGLVYVAAFLPKDGAESYRLVEASGGSRRAGAIQCCRRWRASRRRHAGGGFASRVVRVLRGQRCGVGDRKAVPATSLAVADGSIQPTWSPQRHQPVLRVVYAGSGYPTAIAAADGRREHVRRRH
jgi:pimeloyl-ACP methyl ester carboxylesterase